MHAQSYPEEVKNRKGFNLWNFVADVYSKYHSLKS